MRAAVRAPTKAQLLAYEQTLRKLSAMLAERVLGDVVPLSTPIDERATRSTQAAPHNDKDNNSDDNNNNDDDQHRMHTNTTVAAASVAAVVRVANNEKTFKANNNNDDSDVASGRRRASESAAAAAAAAAAATAAALGLRRRRRAAADATADDVARLDESALNVALDAELDLVRCCFCKERERMLLCISFFFSMMIIFDHSPVFK